MDPFAVSHFSNDALRHDLKTRVASDCRSTAVLLTRIAEFDERTLFLPEGYPSMFTYCLHELHFSEDATYRYINAARTARRFPGVLVALADGRLHLRAVLMLACHLTSGNADELVAAATHKTRAEIEQFLARRFPRPDLPERLRPIPAPPPIPNAAPQQGARLSAQVEPGSPSTGEPAAGLVDQLAPEQVQAAIPDQPVHVEAPLPAAARQLAPEQVESPALRDRMMPLAPGRFGLQSTVDQETHDLLQEAQDLMSHQVRAGEIAPVLKCALKMWVGHLRKQKFAATACPRPAARGSAKATGGDVATATRHIPAAVKRAVRERDGGQCTFVSDAAHRCGARTRLEFDHIEAVARGGKATTENIRLRCRVHNQYTAECTFGAEFMERKRAEAQRAGRRGKDGSVPTAAEAVSRSVPQNPPAPAPGRARSGRFSLRR
jgi:hypothetical protein